MKPVDPNRRFARAVVAACAVIWLVDGFLTLIGRIAPVWIYPALGIAFGVLCLWLGRKVAPSHARAWALGGALFVASLVLWPGGARKRFFRDVAQLEPGQDRAEVSERMAAYAPEHPLKVYGAYFPYYLERDGRTDYWMRGDRSFDHVVVRYDESDRVLEVESVFD